MHKQSPSVRLSLWQAVHIQLRNFLQLQQLPVLLDQTLTVNFFVSVTIHKKWKMNSPLGFPCPLPHWAGTPQWCWRFMGERKWVPCCNVDDSTQKKRKKSLHWWGSADVIEHMACQSNGSSMMHSQTCLNLSLSCYGFQKRMVVVAVQEWFSHHQLGVPLYN